MMKCALYIRVSNEKVLEDSLHYQKELLYGYAQESKWDISQCYIDILCGTKTDRSSLQKMIQDAAKKKFDIILTTDLSRLSRKTKILYEIKHLCDNKGIQLLTLDSTRSL